MSSASEPIRTSSGTIIGVYDADGEVRLGIGDGVELLDPEAALQLSAKLAVHAMAAQRWPCNCNVPTLEGAPVHSPHCAIYNRVDEDGNPDIWPSAEVQLQQECDESLAQAGVVAKALRVAELDREIADLQVRS